MIVITIVSNRIQSRVFSFIPYFVYISFKKILSSQIPIPAPAQEDFFSIDFNNVRTRAFPGYFLFRSLAILNVACQDE